MASDGVKRVRDPNRDEPESRIRPGESDLTDRPFPGVPPAAEQLGLRPADRCDLRRLDGNECQYLFWTVVAVLVLELACFAGMQETAPPPAGVPGPLPGAAFWHFVLGVLGLWCLGVGGVVLSLVGVCVARHHRLRFVWLLVASLALPVVLTVAVDPVYEWLYGAPPR